MVGNLQIGYIACVSDNQNESARAEYSQTNITT